MFGSLGFPELMLIFGVALLIFGPRKLPDIGRSVGRALGEFRRATNDLKSTLEQEVRLEEEKGSLSVLREPAAPPVSREQAPNPPAADSPAPSAQHNARPLETTGSTPKE